MLLEEARKILESEEGVDTFEGVRMKRYDQIKEVNGLGVPK